MLGVVMLSDVVPLKVLTVTNTPAYLLRSIIDDVKVLFYENL